MGVAEALAALRVASARVKNSIVWDFCGEVKCDSVCALWVSAATIWEGTRPSGLEYWTVYCIKKCDLFQLIKPSHPNIMFAGSHLVASDKHTSVRPLTAVLVCSKEMSNNPRQGQHALVYRLSRFNKISLLWGEWLGEGCSWFYQKWQKVQAQNISETKFRTFCCLIQVPAVPALISVLTS